MSARKLFYLLTRLEKDPGMHLLQVPPGEGFRILLPPSRKKLIMCLTDVSSKLSGAPDFCLSLAHGSCLHQFVGMGLGRGCLRYPPLSPLGTLFPLSSPALVLHLGNRGIL